VGASRAGGRLLKSAHGLAGDGRPQPSAGDASRDPALAVHAGTVGGREADMSVVQIVVIGLVVAAAVNGDAELSAR